MEFTHIEGEKVKMVDISDKKAVARYALATGKIKLRDSTIKAIKDGFVEKGNVLATARIATIQAVKRTPDIIPMCHQIPITTVDVDFDIENPYIRATVGVKSVGKTGVEMEALHGVSVSLLTIWDMVKSAEKDATGNYPFTIIEDIYVVKKEKNEV